MESSRLIKMLWLGDILIVMGMTPITASVFNMIEAKSPICLIGFFVLLLGFITSATVMRNLKKLGEKLPLKNEGFRIIYGTFLGITLSMSGFRYDLVFFKGIGLVAIILCLLHCFALFVVKPKIHRRSVL